MSAAEGPLGDVDSDRPGPTPADSAATPPRSPLRRLDPPHPISASKLRWSYAVSIVIVHAIACAAFVPWLFTWTGLGLCLAGMYIFGTLGVNIGFHRLLTHRGFVCPRWFERSLALLGVCCLQEGPARWVAIHRQHHQHADEQPDPHSPLVTALWGHVGWLIFENPNTDSYHVLDRYARDLVRQPFYRGLERRLRWLWVYALHTLLFVAIGAVLGFWLAPAGDRFEALRIALSIVIWGVFVRTVLVWHITWSVNSLSHLWGYRSHETGENSRNNWLVALLSNGEGWHNNHHHDQRSAAHGHRWWELDVTYLTILLFERLGLASQVMRPERHR